MKLRHIFLILIIVCIFNFLLSGVSVFASEEQNSFDYEHTSINRPLNEDEVIESLINLRMKYEIVYDSEGSQCHEETNSKIKIINDYIMIKANQGVSSACDDCMLHNKKSNRSGLFHISPNCTCNWLNYLMDEPCANCQYYVSVMDGVYLILAGFNIRGWDLAADLLAHNISNNVYDSDYSPSTTLTALIHQAPQISEICSNYCIFGDCNQDTPGRLNGFFASTIEGDVYNSLGKFYYTKSSNGNGSISFNILDRYDWHSDDDCPGGILIDNMVAAETLGIVTPFYTCINIIADGNADFSWDYFNDSVMIYGYYGIDNNVAFPDDIYDFRYHEQQLETVQVERISSWSFEDCETIETITIPSSVTYIGNYAFYGCSNLSLVEIERAQAELTTLGSSAFYGCSSSLQIKVPKNRIADYKNKTGWSNYSSKIIPSSTGFPTIVLTNSVDYNTSCTLSAGYNKLYKLSVGATTDYVISTTASYGRTIKLYDSSMTLLVSSSSTINRTLYSGNIYYLSVEFSSTSSSGTISLSIIDANHTHSYGAPYVWVNYTQHSKTCSCGAISLEGHAVQSGSFGPGQQYATCIMCGGLATVGFIGPMLQGSYPTTHNGSYILPNRVIVLVEDDVEAYKDGTLIFNYLNVNSPNSNIPPYILKREEDVNKVTSL